MTSDAKKLWFLPASLRTLQGQVCMPSFEHSMNTDHSGRILATESQTVDKDVWDLLASVLAPEDYWYINKLRRKQQNFLVQSTDKTIRKGKLSDASCFVCSAWHGTQGHRCADQAQPASSILAWPCLGSGVLQSNTTGWESTEKAEE